MEKENKEEKKELTTKTVLAWIIGSIFLISGITNTLSGSFTPGVLFVLASLFVLPPTYKLLKDKLNFNLSRGLRVFIALILVFIAFIIVGKDATPSYKTNSNSTNKKTTEKVYYASKEYVEIFSFSGDSIKKSEPFTVTGDRFKIKYNCNGSYCGATLYRVGSSLMSDLIMNSTNSVSDESIFYGSGEYYIDVNSIGTFSMTVEDYK